MKPQYNIILLCSAFTFANESTYAQQVNAEKGTSTFSPLKVSAGQETPSQQALEKTGAVSTRETDKNLESLDATLRSMPGTFTQIDPGQGAVSVNIRGFSGLGRVNSMVDGVTQSFYGTSNATLAHGSTNNMAGIMIDPNFLVGVDVIRGDSSGPEGVNALSGSANFRTIDVEDVIFPGNSLGFRSRFSVGNNGLGRSGMVSVAGQADAFTETGNIGLLMGVSGSTVYSNYDTGNGINTEKFGMNKYLKQNPQSQLYKLDMKLNDFHKVKLSARNYTNHFTQRKIESDDYYLKYHYTPFSELVDTKLTVSTSRGNQRYDNNSLYTFYNTSAQNRSNALDVNNTSRFSWRENDFSMMFGGKLMKTKYSKIINSSIANENTAEEAIENNTFAPQGEQDISSIYGGLKINRGIFEADFNLNYTNSKIKGFKPACDPRVICVPQGGANIDSTNHNINPMVMLSAQVTPWLQPFVSYSKSSRAPNIQEMFFSNSGGASMNPFLKPEHAETWQAGFNINSRDILMQDDALRLKATAYTSRVKYYIHSKSFLVCGGGEKCDFEHAYPAGGGDNTSDDFYDNMYIYINSITPVHTRGVELELDYDAGFAFGRLAYSRQHTDQPTSIASTSFGAGDITELPKQYLTLDTGMRFIDSALVVGAMVKYTGKTKRISPNFDLDETTSAVLKEDMPQIPTILDLYSTYQVTQNLLLKFNVQNVMGRDYSEALNKMNMSPVQGDTDTAGNTARGRTFIFGGEVRF
jgi:hemoglobin/transferrin/lactoferrin receptor protein